jgi:hypothetical protein
MVAIIPRATWGARAWSDHPHSVPMSERRYFVVHYDGGSPITRTGYAIPRTIDAEHHGNGWAGIGYNFVVSQAGEVFEGRGWDLVGAHCPSRNRDGIGVQIAIGGDQQPSATAEATARALYDEACKRAGRTLTMTWHGANYATECPGQRLISWVRAGMPASNKPAPAPQEDDMKLEELAGWDVSKLCGEKPGTVNFQTFVGRVYKATVKAQAQSINYDKLAAALAARGVSVDAKAVAAAVVEQLGRELTD